MSNTPENLKYTKEHEWVEGISNTLYRVGITDFAQSALGDIVYVQLPKSGDLVEAGSVCGEVESTKSVSEIFSPLSGKVVKVNSALDANPEVINSDPYGAGWIVEIEITDAAQIALLLSPQDYKTLTA